MPDELEPIELGKARVLREGSDVTVVAIGRMVPEALQAAEQAEQEGISVEVIDPRTLLPLDEETIVASVKKTTRCVTAHEAVTRGGFGAELAAVVQQGAFDYLDAPIERVGAKFAPLAFAPAMEQWVVPHAADVLEAVKRTVARELAMATEVKLPRLGQGMESGTIVKWLKGEGEPVKKREPLYELDTDKVTQEVEAEADGVLLKIVVDAGEVEVGRTIAFIGTEGEDVPPGTAPRRGDRGRGRDDAAAVEEQASRRRGRVRAEDGRRARARPGGRRGDRGGRDRRVAEAPRDRRPRQGIAARAPDRPREGDRHRRARRAPGRRAGSSPRTSSGRPSRRRRPRPAPTLAAATARSRRSS